MQPSIVRPAAFSVRRKAMNRWLSAKKRFFTDSQEGLSELCDEALGCFGFDSLRLEMTI